MSDEPKGLRAVPPALLLAFVVWFVLTIVRLAYMASHEEWYRSARFGLASEGLGFAAYVLVAFGALDLMRRLAGRAALGMKIVTIGFATVLALDVLWAFVTMADKWWEHEWLGKTMDYAFFAAWFAVPVGLAVALWRERLAHAVAVLVLGFLTFPPTFFARAFYEAIDFEGKNQLYFDTGLRCVRLAVLLWAIAAVARGVSPARRELAVIGMRNAAKALWLRIIAAVGVVLITLMVIGGKGSEGSLSALKLAMVTAAVVNVIALAMFGVGVMRAGRAEVPGLPRWPLIVAGATSLWGTGVTLAQMPYIYKALYGGDSSMVPLQEYAQALAIAMPLVILGGIAVLAFALGSFAHHRGDAELGAQAQAKGAGFVALSLVALAISQWMLPKAQSMGSFAMLSLLAAGAGLVATAMMASLCGRASVTIDSEPGLPSATVVES